MSARHVPTHADNHHARRALPRSKRGSAGYALIVVIAVGVIAFLLGSVITAYVTSDGAPRQPDLVRAAACSPNMNACQIARTNAIAAGQTIITDCLLERSDGTYAYIVEYDANEPKPAGWFCDEGHWTAQGTWVADE